MTCNPLKRSSALLMASPTPSSGRAALESMTEKSSCIAIVALSSGDSGVCSKVSECASTSSRARSSASHCSRGAASAATVGARTCAYLAFCSALLQLSSLLPTGCSPVASSSKLRELLPQVGSREGRVLQVHARKCSFDFAHLFVRTDRFVRFRHSWCSNLWGSVKCFLRFFSDVFCQTFEVLHSFGSLSEVE